MDDHRNRVHSHVGMMEPSRYPKVHGSVAHGGMAKQLDHVEHLSETSHKESTSLGEIKTL